MIHHPIAAPYPIWAWAGILVVHPTAAYISNTAPWPSLDKGFINPRHDIQRRAYLIRNLMHMCSPIMKAAFGRVHNSGAGAFGAYPTVVDSFKDGCVGAGEAADAAKHT